MSVWDNEKLRASEIAVLPVCRKFNPFTPFYGVHRTVRMTRPPFSVHRQREELHLLRLVSLPHPHGPEGQTAAFARLTGARVDQKPSIICIFVTASGSSLRHCLGGLPCRSRLPPEPSFRPTFRSHLDYNTPRSAYNYCQISTSLSCSSLRFVHLSNGLCSSRFAVQSSRRSLYGALYTSKQRRSESSNDQTFPFSCIQVGKPPKSSCDDTSFLLHRLQTIQRAEPVSSPSGSLRCLAPLSAAFKHRSIRIFVRQRGRSCRQSPSSPAVPRTAHNECGTTHLMKHSAWNTINNFPQVI